MTENIDIDLGSFQVILESYLNLSANYFIPTINGVNILVDIPAEADELKYYNAFDNELIGSSSVSGDMISFETSDEIVNIDIVALLDGYEIKDNDRSVRVNRDMSELST